MGGGGGENGKKWCFATVCSSNMNRSMEAHFQLQNLGFDVRSYGTGTNVRLPGPSQDRPNVYEFGTPYSEILADLTRKDAALYTHNGLINMLNRNVKVKTAPGAHVKHITCSPRPTPCDDAESLNKSDRALRDTDDVCGASDPSRINLAERWQDHDRSLPLDVVLTYEERVFDAVIQDLQAQDSEKMQPLHVINLDTRDNHEEAAAAAVVTCRLAAMLEEQAELEGSIANTLSAFEAQTKRPTLYSLVYV